jgi:hypothetical protein
MSVVKTFRLALAYAKFDSKEVKAGLTKLVDDYDRDMEECNYEPSAATEKSEKELQETMNEVDQASEEAQEAFQAGAATDESEPA